MVLGGAKGRTGCLPGPGSFRSSTAYQASMLTHRLLASPVPSVATNRHLR